MEYAYLSIPTPRPPRPEPKRPDTAPTPYPDHEQSWIIEDLDKAHEEKEKKEQSSHVVVIEL